jgi:spermidine synthase
MRERLSQPARPNLLAELGFDDEFSVLGGVLAGPAALARFSANSPANTDDRPVVMYAAPRITYAPDSLPRDRLSAVLHELSVEPSELIEGPPGSTFSVRLAAYWSARDRFIDSGRNVRPAQRVEDMLAQVREPLLSVLRISPEFRPAYDPLFAMSRALARSDVAAARALLDELARLSPARGEAARMLSQLVPASSSPDLVRH